MKHIGVSTYQLFLSAFAVTALSALFVVFPIKASALEVVSQTQQILPPGANTCAPIQVSDFTPYIYNNALNSFEFTVSDPSYVAVVGSVGNTSIPLHFMTRLPSSTGGIRIHVDVNTTPLTGTVPVAITLLSAKTGEPVCASVVAVSLGSGPVAQAPSYPTPVPSKPAPSVAPSAPSAPVSPTPSTAPQGSVSTGTAVAPIVGSGIMKSPMERLCSSQESAYRLWLVLLVLYAILVGGILWLEFPMSWAWAQTPERVASSILVLLILLLGFWYFSIPCRAALWMPLVAFLIAILGLLAAFWNHPRMTQLLLIENTNL